MKGYEIGDLVRIKTFHEGLTVRDCDGNYNTDQYNYDLKYYQDGDDYPMGIVISEKKNFGQTLVSVKDVATGNVVECHWYDVEKIINESG